MKRQLKYLFYITIAPLIGIVYALQLTLLFLLNETIRLCISLYLKYGENGNNNNVKLAESGSDAIWGYKKPHSSRNVLVYCVAQKGYFTRDLMHKLFSHAFDYQDGHIRPYEKFEWILTTKCGFICWKRDENYNLWNHIKPWRKGANQDTNNDGNSLINEQEIIDGLSELEKDMEECKPQWELIPIPRVKDKVTNEEKSALVIRFNHAYFDGLSFVMFFKERLGLNMSYTIDPLKFRIPTWKKFLFYSTAILYGPAFSLQMLFSKSLKTPWVVTKTLNGAKRCKNFAKSEYVSSSLIKKIQMNTARPGGSSSVTVNDVVILALVSALKSVLPRERLAAEIRVGTIIAMLPYPNTHPRNRFTNYSYKWNTQKAIARSFEDLSTSLQDISRRNFKALLGPESLTSLWVFDFYGRFPSWVTSIVMSGAYDSFFISNVPFSKGKAEIKFGGQLEEVSAWPPQPNDTGISFATVGYDGKFKITGSADSEWLSKSELDAVFELLPKEIQRLADLCPFSEATWRLPEYYKNNNRRITIKDRFLKTD